MPPKYPNGVITQYSIEYDGKVFEKFGGDVSDTMNGLIEGLLPDTDYVFKLRAHTRVGSGPLVNLNVKTCKLLNINVTTFLSLKMYVSDKYYFKLLINIHLLQLVLKINNNKICIFYFNVCICM